MDYNVAISMIGFFFIRRTGPYAFDQVKVNVVMCVCVCVRVSCVYV